MKLRNTLGRSVVALLALLSVTSLAHAQKSWTGAVNNNWSTDGNWDVPPTPGSSETAQFNGPGNSNTSISLGGVPVSIGNIAFDSASAAEYSLGVLASGDAFNIDASGTITVGAGVPTLQTINAVVNGSGDLDVTNNGDATGGLTLAANISSTGTLTLTNNTAGSTLTVGGNIAAAALNAIASAGSVVVNGDVASDGIMNVGGSSGGSSVTFNGIISGSGSVSSTTMPTGGSMTFNGQNTYSGGSIFATPTTPVLHQPQVRLGASTVGSPGSVTSGPLGTGTITAGSGSPHIFVPIGDNRTIANDWTLSGSSIFIANNTTVDPTPRSLTLTGPINVVGGRAITNNLVEGAVLTLGSADSPSTITRNNTLTFQSQSGAAGPNGGVLVINNSISGTAGNHVVTFQNGLKVTLNNTIDGNGNVTVTAAGTVARFNKTGMYAGSGTFQIIQGATGYFDQPDVLQGGTGAFSVSTGGTAHIDSPLSVGGNHTVSGVGTTSYVNADLHVGGTFNITGGGVAYLNAPTTYSGTGNGMNIQAVDITQTTALVVNSTLTRTGAATSPVRVVTGTLAGNGGTIFAPVDILNNANGPSYLAPGTPAPPGGDNTKPSYENGPGLLTIGSPENPFDLNFNGNSTNLCATCNFNAEIGGLTAGTQYDQVVVYGTLTIGSTNSAQTPWGTLNVSLIDDFSPTSSATFEIMKATTRTGGPFATVNLPSPDWSVEYTSTSVLLHFTGSAGVPGDYNGNGTVDAADYVLWRKDPTNPANGYVSDPSDGYNLWRTNFGNPPGAGSGLGENTSVPEPASLAIIGLVGAIVALARPCRRTRSRS